METIQYTSDDTIFDQYIALLINREVEFDKEIFYENFLRNIRAALITRGETIMDSGFVYAPYIPMMTTPVVVESIISDVIISDVIKSRYEKKINIEKYYKKSTL